MLALWPSSTSNGEFIFCDVLPAAKDKDKDIIPQLHYIKLPKPLQRNKTPKGDARLYCNIAVIGNRLKYVELQRNYKTSVIIQGQFLRNGWMTATWSRLVNKFSSDGWRQDNRIMNCQDLNVDKEMYFKLIPKVQNHEGATLAPFMRLDIFQLMLSLGDSMDIIDFTAKQNYEDAIGWVVSVDLENKQLLCITTYLSAIPQQEAHQGKRTGTRALPVARLELRCIATYLAAIPQQEAHQGKRTGTRALPIARLELRWVHGRKVDDCTYLLHGHIASNVDYYVYQAADGVERGHMPPSICNGSSRGPKRPQLRF
ncbi:hypothetical protein BAE44_0002351 [Dichanthelium oligosanthes]|uniref:DUF1618 domain-containing protein n=1 Tax=Dichanthelium oligosanthes TaxID=888268 RepID=A0A1E5WGV5_9POAL|nr:hypothetical protein BAE44_0002351 [Dichanthelium oligosanthes]